MLKNTNHVIENSLTQSVGFDKDIAIQNLSDAKTILDSLGMRNWLTDGTLLGYYRENDFIAHDLDMDMGSFIEDFDKDITKRFKENGWDLLSTFGKLDIGYELSYIRNGVKLDIFFFYKENDKYWHGAWRPIEKKGRNLIKYYYDSFGLKEVEFKGQLFNVPEDTLHYIETKYGPDWKTPQKSWDWAFGPSNAVETDFYLKTSRNILKRIVNRIFKVLGLKL